MSAAILAVMLVSLHPARAGEAITVCHWRVTDWGPPGNQLVCERIIRLYEVRT